MTRTITVDHLARVEGHGGITVFLDGDRIEKMQFDVFEGIRLFEGLVRGAHCTEVPQIVSRICAICSHGHTVASLHALEKALGVQVSPQTRMLRDLGFQGASIESHALHVFALALPDFVGQPSVIQLAGVAPDAVKLALRLKKLGNTIQEVVGGRAVHPVNYVIGGFGRVPTLDELIPLREEIVKGLEDCKTALAFLKGVEIPAFVSEPIRCAATVPEGEAFFFGEKVRLQDGPDIPISEYRSLTNEHLVPHSNAKHSLYDGRSYMVGSLARLTLHGDRIAGMARKAWDELGFRTPSANIVMNNVAQAIEMVYSVEHAHRLVTRMIEGGLRDEKPVPFTPRAGRGSAIVEVPRGGLIHSYELDSEGRVASADVITPTAQNFSNAEDQFRATVRDAKGQPDEVLRHRLEIVARAYDPCISCSVHVVRARG